MGSRLERNSDATRKRIEAHTFNSEDGEEYSASTFGGFSDYMRRKKAKLQNLDAEMRSQSSSNPPIFRGVVAHVNGYTQPSLADIHRLIVSYGGGFLQYLGGKTSATHIIASALTPKKAVEFRRYRIVKPAWVVDSVKAGKLLPWDAYRVLDEGTGQRVLGFTEDGSVTSQRNDRERGYRDQTETSWYTSQLRGTEPRMSQGSRSFLRTNQESLPSPEAEVDDIVDIPPSHQPVPQEAPSTQLQLSTDSKDDEDHDVTTTSASEKSPLELESAQDALNTPPKTSPSPEEPVTAIKRQAEDPIETPSKRTKLTAEEHNKILLADPNIRKSTVLNPDFLEQYYRESRLHHLSIWKADLKSQLQALAAEKSSSQKARQKRDPRSRRYILHVDFDSFFAAVSLKKHPEFKDKPSVVAHGPGSGSEIASCNYPARKFGIKNGMWMKRAQEMCPDLKVLPYDFPAYEEASRSFYDAILATNGIVQSVSIDEALVDITYQCIEKAGTDGRWNREGGVYREHSACDEIAQGLRASVKEKTGCDVSVGIGGNILLAKVALRKAKPAGQYHVKPEDALDFLADLEVRDLPGVAWSIGGKLEEIGIRFVRDIRQVSREKLTRTLGPKTGEKLWDYARGIDRVEVGDQPIRKSVSAEVNWGVRFENQEQTDEFIGYLGAEVARRLLKEKVRGSQLTMKVMRRSPDAPLDPPKHLGHGKCDTYNKSVVLGVPTTDHTVIAREALSMLKSFGFSPGELRGLGVQMTKLEPLKGTNTDSSQRRLQFKKSDKISSPHVFAKAPVAAQQLSEDTTRPGDAIDPIRDEIMTPKKTTKTTSIAFGPAALNSSSPSRKPLNTSGTQFLLPTQVDPSVLAELPADIRTKLARQSKSSKQTTQQKGALDKFTIKRPPQAPPATALPSASQLDPDIIASLPADIRAELREHYSDTTVPLPPSPTPAAKQISKPQQALLPNFPRKPKAIPPKKRGRPVSAVGIAKLAPGNKTLTQFLPKKDGGPTEPRRFDGAPSQLDDEFLAALPEDIRSEIVSAHTAAKNLAAHRAARTERLRSLHDPNHPLNAVPPPQKPRTIPVKSRPRPTFTKKGLQSVPELREAVKDWVEEFREEGPYREDVDALAEWCAQVVLEERDIGKTRRIVAWWAWCVDEFVILEEAGDEKDKDEDIQKRAEAELKRSKRRWHSAVERLKERVQLAMKERGLGNLTWD